MFLALRSRSFWPASFPLPLTPRTRLATTTRSLIGEPRYPADFKHFDYVNPDAPKGGLVRLSDVGGFDSLNPVLYKGEPAAGLGFAFESLMADSLDEPSTSYGLIAEWASYPEDYSSVTFKLRDEARWHDGKKITPEDVIYSLEVNKAANPRMGLYYKNVFARRSHGRERGHLLFRRQEQSRAADDHGAAHHSAQALLDGEGRERQCARSDEDDARAAARLRPLPHQGGETRTVDQLRVGRGLLGQRPSGQCGAMEL